MADDVEVVVDALTEEVTIQIMSPAGGDVVGPASAANNSLAAFDGTTGKLIKDSGILSSSVVQTTRSLTAGTGLDGGGDLSADRSFALDGASITSLALADSAIQPGDLAPVATSGDYNDLSNPPTLGSLASLNSVNDSNWSGTPLSIGNGGTGASLTDPNADRILFWDDSAGSVGWLTVGTNLSITGTTLNATGGGGGGGDVFGPASSTDGNVTVFDGVTGKLIKESGIASSNLLLSTGSYNDPAWLTGVDWSKLNSIPTPVDDLAGLSVADGFLRYSSGTLGVSFVAPSDISPVSGYSVIGVSGASGSVGSITAGTDNQVLRRSGTTLGFGAINLASSAAVTGLLPFANFQSGGSLSVFGRPVNGTGVMSSIAASVDHTVLRRSGLSVGFGAIALNQSAAITGNLPLANGGTGASLTAPGSDGILFYDVSATSTAFLSPGNSIAITGTTLDTIQDIRTSASPQFQRLALLNAGDISQFHLNRNTGTGGMYIGSTGIDSNFHFMGGGQYNGVNWVARATDANGIVGGAGMMFFYGDTGLTPGATFSPTVRAVLLPTGRFGIGEVSPAASLHVTTTDAATNSTTEIARFNHSTSGTAAAGFGARIATELENGSGVNRISSTLDTVFTDASNTSEDAELIVNAITAGSLVESARFSGSLGLRLTKVITPAGTTGNQVINAQCGSVNFAAGASSVTVTNSFASSNSVIQATIATNDMDMTALQVTHAAGSFTIHAQPTIPSSEVRVDWLILS